MKFYANNFTNLDCKECLRLRDENKYLHESLRENEDKLKKVLAQMNENISKAKKDKLALENENHRMRIKYAESKVGQMLRNSKSTPNLDKAETSDVLKEEIKSAKSEIELKTTLEFSSEDSLESSMSLVSGALSQSQTRPSSNNNKTRNISVSSKSSNILSPNSTISSSSNEITEVIINAEKGTREKRFKDGRTEIWYSNGNRYIIKT